MEIQIETKYDSGQRLFYEIGRGNKGKAYVPIEVISVATINFNQNGYYPMYNVKDLTDGSIHQYAEELLITVEKIIHQN